MNSQARCPKRPARRLEPVRGASPVPRESAGEWVVRRRGRVADGGQATVWLGLHNAQPLHPEYGEDRLDPYDPAERAKQLSVATGMPTPFYVVRAFATK